MSYHLIWNHGWEVWNENGEVCHFVKWFVDMGKAMTFIDLCNLGEAFKA